MTDPATSPDAPKDRGGAGKGRATGLDRRDVLRGTAAAGAVATIAGFWFEGFGDPLRRRRIQPTAPGAPGKTFTAEEMPVLEAALDRLVPSGPGSPGSRDVNAVGYLDAVLQEPDLDPLWYAEVIKAGLRRLEEAAQQRGPATFPALTEGQQIEVLTGFESTTPGQRWLKRVLHFALEALLGDPVHGCQPGEVGWRWLGNAPPEPRPHVAHWKPEPR